MNENFFANIDRFGELNILKIYGFYDEPQVFSCQSPDGEIYLLIRLGTEEPEWILSEISDSVLDSLEKNKLEIRTPFTNPERGFVFRIFGNTDPLKSEILKPGDIAEDMLPYPGEYLDYQKDEEKREDVKDIASRENRSVIEVSFEENDEHENEISCSALSEALTNIQTLVYSLADEEKKTYGKFSSTLRKQYELKVTDTFAASFGVQMKSSILDEESQKQVGSVIDRLNRLFDVSTDVSALKDFLANESTRTAAYYNRFLNGMKRNNLGFAYRMACPGHNYTKGHFNTKQVNETLSSISNNIKEIKRKEEYEGELRKIDLVNNKFSFISKSENEEIKISGIIGDQLKKKEFMVPSKARILVETTMSFDGISGKEKYKFMIIGIKRLEKPDYF